ncbi:MAG: hypothetical protein GY854_11635 [Deltaproteobacteria bacterium]|nr:hypothetical protein [Deltaproteobacteria bacterium]
MGSNRFFWPQELLDQWMLDEKIIIDGERLSITEENRDYQVKQAVYFAADVGDGSDGHGLIGRVKELSVLEEIGAEYYMDSVLIEDSAYQVVPGFTGEPMVGTNQEKDKASDLSGAIATQVENEDEGDDRELLARFLIENL